MKGGRGPGAWGRGCVTGTALVALALALARPAPRRRVMLLPAGVVEVHSEMLVDAGTEVRGASTGSVLHLAADFAGRAAIVVWGSGVRLCGFTIDGNRGALETRAELPPSDVPFARFTRANGVLANDVTQLSIEGVHFREIAGFAVLAANSYDVFIDGVQVSDSGSRNPAGRNNATGGILLEEGVTDFRVSRSEFRNIRGNAVWTHSLYGSPRNARGIISGNRFENIGRDAIQVGHATLVRVEENTGRRIGFPVEDVDIEHLAVPVAIDTAGNVDRSSYTSNRFDGINGKCIDLDGFHDGEIRGNACAGIGNFGIVMNNSNPDMQSRNIRIVDNAMEGVRFGGIFVIGTGHNIARNRLLRLNAAHCNEEAARSGCFYNPGEPDMLRSGIYLGRGAERPAPARDDVIEDNEITGFHMASRCVALAPAIEPDWNTVRRNVCRDTDSH